MAQEMEEFTPTNFDQSIEAPSDLSDINKWLLEVDSEKEKLLHKFRGEIFDREKQDWVKTDGISPWINDKGIMIIEGHLDAVINKVNLLSALDDKIIEEISISNMDSLITDLADNSDKYDLESSKRDLIVTIVDNFEWAVLLRAKNAGERGLFKKVQYSVQRLYKNPEKDATSVLAPFGR